MKIDSTEAFSSQAGVPARVAALPTTADADEDEADERVESGEADEADEAGERVEAGEAGERVEAGEAGLVASTDFANTPVAVPGTNPACGSTYSESAFRPADDN